MPSTDDVIAWVDAHLEPTWRRDGAHLYEGLASQAAFSLPLIHLPFDADRRAHWVDRGRILDFRAVVGGGRILDVGPGDGWPSLVLAPMVEEVVGVDASATLLDGAKANAARLGVGNVTFRQIASATLLPFADETFDGATASSSLEQTEDPRATLRELRRVLRPGGRLRMYYEGLAQYRGVEGGVWLFGRRDGTAYLFLSDYRPDEERARHVRLHLELAESTVREALGVVTGDLSHQHVGADVLARLQRHVRDARGSRLTHPSGATWLRLLREVGFREAGPTSDGAVAARALFSETPREARPRDVEGVDACLTPRVERAVLETAPIVRDPMITAVR